MPAEKTRERGTARDAVDNWVGQLNELFRRVQDVAATGGWYPTEESIDIRENPFGFGAPFTYQAPVLVLKRPDPQTKDEQRITFEPRHRFTLGAAGRIDVYSYPSFREAMLLRVPDTAGAENLTWDEAEERVARAPWKAFTPERLPLDADVEDAGSLLAFLDNLVKSEQ
jgi:hypothetical protein